MTAAARLQMTVVVPRLTMAAARRLIAIITDTTGITMATAMATTPRGIICTATNTTIEITVATLIANTRARMGTTIGAMTDLQADTTTDPVANTTVTTAAISTTITRGRTTTVDTASITAGSA